MNLSWDAVKNIDWQGTADMVGKAAPLLGSLIGTPATGAAIGMVANALGSDTSPRAISTALRNDPEATARLRQLERDHQTDLRRMALEAETARLAEINRTMRSETASNDGYVRRWRPTFGYLTALAWVVQGLAIAWSIVATPEQAAVVSQAIIALTPMWGIALAVLGINVTKRSHDKQVAAGQSPPGGFMSAVAARIAGS